MLPLITFLLAGALVFPIAAQGQPHPAAALSDQVAESWMDLQKSDGSFRDYVTANAPGAWRDRYGPAVFGAALLQRGVRTGDDRSVQAALRALRYAIAHRETRQNGAFEKIALAEAYKLGRRELRDHPGFARLRPALEARLRGITMAVFGRGRTYFNLYLVESVAVLDVLSTGLRSKVRGSVLAQAKQSRRLATDLINRTLPGVAARSGDLVFVSDPPASPQAYHVLTTAMLARAVDLLGARASNRARQVLADTAQTTWNFMAPDGDVSWSGRSQEQSWTLAMTAAGMSAAGYPGVAERALARLATLYRSSAVGLWVAPVLADGFKPGAEGLDTYVSASAYSALTMLGLEWALGETAPVKEATIGADEPMSAVIGNGAGTFAVVRTPGLWMSVKAAPAPPSSDRRRSFAGDLRYDAGLVALKMQAPDGTWQDVMPPRPRTTSMFDSAGPLLLTTAGPARPVGQRLRLGDNGSVLVDATLQTATGRTVRSLTLRYDPIACGVRITVPAAAGDRWEYSAFFRGQPRNDASTVADLTQVVGGSLPATIVMQSGYVSALSALTRARMSFLSVSGPFAIDVCRP